MTAIGETLRRERLRRNLDLQTISLELKISPRMLEAIENEKFDRLPGGVFTKSFVRQYARFLGLDDEEMAGEVQRMMEPAPEGPSFTPVPKYAPPAIELPRVQSWEALSDRRFQWSSPLPSLALVLVVMMACAGVYSWWQRNRHAVSAHVTAPPAVTAPAAVQPAPVPAQPQDQAPPGTPPVEQSQTAPATSAGDSPAAMHANAQANAQPGTPSTASGAAPNPAAPPSKSGALPAQLRSHPNSPVRVELMADEPVWVLARTDGKYLFSGTLEPNQPRTVEANSVVVLRLGNAGGVSITLNGKSIGAVGPKGQVRTVQLTSGGFEIVAPPKPPAVPLELLF